MHVCFNCYDERVFGGDIGKLLGYVVAFLKGPNMVSFLLVSVVVVRRDLGSNLEKGLNHWLVGLICVSMSHLVLIFFY